MTESDASTTPPPSMAAASLVGTSGLQVSPLGLDRGIEAEVLPACLANGLAVTPWSPLGGG